MYSTESCTAILMCLEALKKLQSTIMDSPEKVHGRGRSTDCAAGQSFDGIFEGGRNGPRPTDRTTEQKPCQNTSSQLVVIVMAAAAAAGTNVVSVPHQSGGALTLPHPFRLPLFETLFQNGEHLICRPSKRPATEEGLRLSCLARAEV